MTQGLEIVLRDANYRIDSRVLAAKLGHESPLRHPSFSPIFRKITKGLQTFYRHPEASYFLPSRTASIFFLISEQFTFLQNTAVHKLQIN